MNKKIKNAQKITLDGITFRSKLESRVYELFKEASIKVSYEPGSIILQEKMKLSNVIYIGRKGRETSLRKIEYTPDFVLERKGRLYIIECKGYANDAYPLKKKLVLKTLEDRGKPITFIEIRTIAEAKELINQLKHE